MSGKDRDRDSDLGGARTNPAIGLGAGRRAAERAALAQSHDVHNGAELLDRVDELRVVIFGGPENPIGLAAGLIGMQDDVRRLGNVVDELRDEVKADVKQLRDKISDLRAEQRDASTAHETQLRDFNGKLAAHLTQQAKQSEESAASQRRIGWSMVAGIVLLIVLTTLRYYGVIGIVK